VKLSEALEMFLTACAAANLSKRTITWYREFISRLVVFLHDPYVKQMTAYDLNRFLADLRGKQIRWEHHPRCKPTNGELSVSTLAGYVRAIKRLFNWLEQEGQITTGENVALRLKNPKVPKGAMKEISMGDLRALLDGARKRGTWGKRDYAIILFLIDTGCRVGGLVNLKISDLDLANGRALVTEKGNKTRFVFFRESEGALRDWLAERPNDTDLVFPGRHGPMKICGVYFMLRRLKARVGIKGRVNPHSFRHAFAKLYLIDGGDLASLSDIMGHSDVKVTKDSYTVFVTDELKRKHDQHTPLSKILGLV
jgi:site-specific recombinase XerD